MNEKHVFEILLYREAEKVFYQKYDAALHKHLHVTMRDVTSSSVGEEFKMGMENDYWMNYGGPWNYNQCIGAIRLFITGNQIRGDLWLSNRKRFTRKMHNKNISLQGKAFELTIHREAENEEIYEDIINRIAASLGNSRRTIADLTCFHNVGKHIDWRGLIDNHYAKEPK